MGAVLAASDICFSYKGSGQIIPQLTESFYSHEIVAVSGESGKGKSTLLYVLGLMLRPVSGELRISGRLTNTMTDAERSSLRAHDFGFVFQDAALDATRNVLDNIVETALYRNERTEPSRGRALELMRAFGVDVRPDRRPGQVSGGQAQRIALCRALLHEPKILLADEPTGNLDKSSAAVVIDALVAHASRGNVVIVASHDEALIKACNRNIVL